MKMSEIMDRVVGELRDERERLRGELARVECALASLETVEDAPVVMAEPAPKAREPRVSRPRGESQAALLEWLGEHPNSGIAAVISGLGWDRATASAALSSAKRAGAITTLGEKRGTTYSVTSQAVFDAE